MEREEKGSKGMDCGTRGFALLDNLSYHPAFIPFQCRLAEDGRESVAGERERQKYCSFLAVFHLFCHIQMSFSDLINALCSLSVLFFNHSLKCSCQYACSHGRLYSSISLINFIQSFSVISEKALVESSI